MFLEFICLRFWGVKVLTKLTNVKQKEIEQHQDIFTSILLRIITDSWS